MVVMETVRAATLASQRKKDRLAKEASKASLPLATSSPSDKGLKKSGLVCSIGVRPPSPILSDNLGSTSLPEELVRYRNQTYVAPEKLQIVKPLEGSVTLLKWKLLASPQLGGATSFFADSTQPGVHRKRWKAGGVIDEGHSQLAGTKPKSLSTTDISSLMSQHGAALSNELLVGKNDKDPTHITPTRLSCKPVHEARSDESSTAHLDDRSVLSQVGSFLGSRFGFGTSRDSSLHSKTPTKQRQENEGLSSLLDS
jgi:hypothetical protein